MQLESQFREIQSKRTRGVKNVSVVWMIEVGFSQNLLS